MEKYIVPIGSKIPIETAFNSLQDASNLNLARRFKGMFGGYGSKLDPLTLVTAPSTGMGETIYFGNVTVRLAPNVFIYPSGEVSENTTATEYSFYIDNSGSVPIDAGFYIIMKHLIKNSEPVQVVDNYTYGDSGIVRYTRVNDSFTLRTSIGGYTLTSDEIILGRISLINGELDTKSYLAKVNSDFIKTDDFMNITTSNNVKTFLHNYLLKFKNATRTLFSIDGENNSVSIGTDVVADVVNGTITFNKSTKKVVVGSTGLGVYNGTTNNLNIDSDGNITTNGYIDIASGILKFKGQQVIHSIWDTCPPVLPINLRVESITGTGLNNYTDSSTSYISLAKVKGESSNQCNVSIKWGYELTGSSISGNNYVTYDSDGSTGIPISVVGYYLYVTSSGSTKNYKIIGQTSNKLTLQNLDGTTAVLPTANYGMNNLMAIHSNAEYYEIVAIPFDRFGALKYSERVEDTITFGDNFVIQQKTLKLPMGTKFLIKIRAVGGALLTPYSELVDSLGNHFILVAPPSISDENSSVGVTTTNSGFLVTITGWAQAEEYEICYTTDKSGADFYNSAHSRLISTSTKIDVPTSYSAEFSVAVRPLKSGYQVGRIITNTVVSGNGGVPPNAVVLAAQDIEFKTFSGTGVFAIPDDRGSIDPGGQLNLIKVTLSAMKYPAFIGRTATGVPTTVVGEVLSYSYASGKYYDYLIVDVIDSVTLIVQPLGDAIAVPASIGTKSVCIGCTERGRLVIKQSQIPVDYKVIKIDVDCDVVYGGTVNMRVYQQGNIALADHSITVNKSDYSFSSPCDVNILGTVGPRNLCIDLFNEAVNPAEGVNRTCFTGRITVYGMPITESNSKYITKYADS